MAKSLFDRVIDIRKGALESRLVARMETEGRPLTDEETIAELQYLKETLPYAGYEPEDIKDQMSAINYILNRYGKH